jgi:hypothetical protein
MRSAAECLAKAEELSSLAAPTGSALALDLLGMADGWRSLARLAAWQDAMSIQLLESHRIR